MDRPFLYRKSLLDGFRNVHGSHLVSSRLLGDCTCACFISMAPLRPHPSRVAQARERSAHNLACSVAGQWPPQASNDLPWPTDSFAEQFSAFDLHASRAASPEKGR
eukprot:4379735-Pyramimonas_sp.AAC.1